MAKQAEPRITLTAKVAHSAVEISGPSDQAERLFDKWLDAVRFALSEEREQLQIKRKWPIEKTVDEQPRNVGVVIERTPDYFAMSSTDK